MIELAKLISNCERYVAWYRRLIRHRARLRFHGEKRGCTVATVDLGLFGPRDTWYT